MTTTQHTRTATPSTAPGRTRLLLTGLAIAGPLWTAVALGQVATRPGFDLTRHPLSLLSRGDLGWLQITNFVVAGVLTVAGVAGLRRAMVGSPGGWWAPRLLAVEGLGLVAAGVLVMDPGDGFPAPTPAGAPATMSWHAIGHMVAGTVTFAALIAACYVLGHHFRRTGRARLALASRVAGTVMLVCVGWSMAGGAVGSLTLAIGVITAMLWVAVAAVHCRRGV